MCCVGILVELLVTEFSNQLRVQSLLAIPMHLCEDNNIPFCVLCCDSTSIRKSFKFLKQMLYKYELFAFEL